MYAAFISNYGDVLVFHGFRTFCLIYYIILQIFYRSLFEKLQCRAVFSFPGVWSENANPNTIRDWATSGEAISYYLSSHWHFARFSYFAYFASGLADSSHRTYTSSQFCPLPASENAVILFFTHLTQRITPQSIGSKWLTGCPTHSSPV